MKKEICLCDNCETDLKFVSSFLIITASINSYNGMAFWTADNMPCYAGEKHFCNIKCYIDFLKKGKIIL